MSIRGKIIGGAGATVYPGMIRKPNRQVRFGQRMVGNRLRCADPMRTPWGND